MSEGYALKSGTASVRRPGKAKVGRLPAAARGREGKLQAVVVGWCRTAPRQARQWWGQNSGRLAGMLRVVGGGGVRGGSKWYKAQMLVMLAKVEARGCTGKVM